MEALVREYLWGTYIDLFKAKKQKFCEKITNIDEVGKNTQNYCYI